MNEVVNSTNPIMRAAFETLEATPPTLSEDLGNGTLSVSLTGLTVGARYVVQAVGGNVTAITLDADAITLDSDALTYRAGSFVASATSHTVAATGGTATAITVKRITGAASAPPNVQGVNLRGALPLPGSGINTNFAVGSPTVHQYLAAGYHNSAFGYNVQSQAVTAALCSAFGSSAQSKITSSYGSSAFGFQSQMDLATGSFNTSAGANSSVNLEDGDGNSHFGAGSGSKFVHGNYNTSVGTQAGSHPDQTDSNGSMQLGVDSTGTPAYTTADNEIALGTTLHTFKCGAVNGETGFWALGVAKAGTPSAPASPTYLTVKVDGTVYDIPVGPGGGSGIPASTIDAKGDLLVGTADNTVARLPVGTNGHVLTVDSGEAAGVKWAAPSGGTATRWALRLPGTIGNYVSTPNTALNYAGMTELDLRWVGIFRNLDTQFNLISNSPTAAAGGFGFNLRHSMPTIDVLLLVGNAGSNSIWTTSGWNSTNLVLGEVIGLRMVWRADAGSGTPDLRFFTSADEGATWTERTVVFHSGAGLPTSMTTPTSSIEMGFNGVRDVLTASIRRNGTLVAEYDARDGIVQRYTDPQGNLWTVNGSAWSGRKGI